jgi:translation initiation factor IF-3
VAKIMDYGKFKYEEAQKAKEARRNQANTILKEVRFRLKIDTHDYETKRKHAEGFLAAGDKVKAMILFRGREQSRPEQGVRLLQRFAEDVAEFGSVESTPTIDGRNMVMVIGPHKSKATAKAEADARRAASKPARVSTGSTGSTVSTGSTTEAPAAKAPAAAKAPVSTSSTTAAPAVVKADVPTTRVTAPKAPAVDGEPVAPVAEKPIAAAPVKPAAAKPAVAKAAPKTPAPAPAPAAAAKPAPKKPAAPAGETKK